MKKCIWLLISFIIPSFFFGEENLTPSRKTVCLNMIVKNESHVIKRCLASVKPLIDYWIIVDTGSTDNTQEIIQEFMKEIPGALYERPWVDFGHNRSEALSLAKGKADYVLFMDADERLEFSSGFTSLPLEKDFYYVKVSSASQHELAYNRFLLINNALTWDWKDVLHEYLVVPKEAKTSEFLTNVVCVTNSDGARSQDPKKYYKDAAILEKALEKDPNNARYVFYLAQSYANAKEYELAIQNYEKRASMEGIWKQEVFWSLYCAARFQQFLGKPEESFLQNYMKAYQADPLRAEPLYYLIEYYNKKGQFLTGYALGKLAKKIPRPQDEMYIDHWIYDFGITGALSCSAFELKKYDEAKLLFQELLSMENLPDPVRKAVREHLYALPVF